jgi:hypothetical protein
MYRRLAGECVFKTSINTTIRLVWLISKKKKLEDFLRDPKKKKEESKWLGEEFENPKKTLFWRLLVKMRIARED